jgi:serine/threonine protein kinase/predicted Zn-dependent protease
MRKNGPAPATNQQTGTDEVPGVAPSLSVAGQDAGDGPRGLAGTGPVDPVPFDQTLDAPPVTVAPAEPPHAPCSQPAVIHPEHGERATGPSAAALALEREATLEPPPVVMPLLPIPPTPALETVPPAPSLESGEQELAPIPPETLGNRFAPAWPKVGEYEVLGELGRGGMGVVYKAMDRRLKRLVALKMLLGEGAGWEALTRFQTEAEAIAQLAHPNFVQVYEVGEHQGQPFFALEFVEGGSLDRRLRGTPQPPQESAALVRVLALAMQAAHEKHIIHRDLKPANILLAGTLGAPGQETSGKRQPSKSAGKPTGDSTSLAAVTPKITDFGLAKKLTEEVGQTISGAIMGTPSYMAPEQAEGRLRDIDARSDVWALGAILYEMLTGRPPFRGASVLDTLEQVRTQDPVPPSRLTQKLPRDVETICLKCLQKEPFRRYQSAEALADDLQCYLDGRPISARPVSAWGRALKWARRRPAQAALVVALLLVVLTGAAGALIFGLYQEQQAVAVKQRLDRNLLVNEGWTKGQEAETAKEYLQAKEHYDQALTTLDTDVDLADADLRRLIAEGRERVLRNLKEKEIRQKEALELSAQREDFQKRGDRFGEHRDQVLIHDVGFFHQDAAKDIAVIRQEAEAALAEWGLSVDSRQEAFSTGLKRWRNLIKEKDPKPFDRLVSECYEVLLVWAEAETTTAPRKALRLLDGASALGTSHGLAAPQGYHLRRGRVLELLGDKDGARVEEKRAAAIPMNSPLDHFQAGLESYRKGQIEQAAACCEEALGKEGDHFWAQYLKALCNMKAKRWREAKVGLATCVARKPDSAPLLLALGAAHGELGDALTKTGEIVAARKEIVAAEAVFRRALDKADAPPLRAAVLTGRSVLRIRQERWEDACRDLLKAVELQPRTYQGYVNLAQAYQLRGDLEEAVKVLDRALRLHPDAVLFNTRARLHAKRGKPALARADFEQVITREPPGARSVLVASARVELAQLKYEAREYGAALADCEAALAAQPNYAPAHRQRGRTLLALGKYDEAGKAMDRYLAGGLRNPVFYQARGLIHTQRGEHVQAAEAYTRSLLLKPDAKTLNYRGWAYLALESPRLALPDFEGVLHTEPKNTDALCGRGLARVQLGHAAEATADAEAALRQAPRPDRRLVQSCARIYARAVGVSEATGDRPADGGRAFRWQERALQLLREALKFVPEAEWVDFWRTNVNGDPAFRSIRNSQGWRALARVCAR